MPACSMTRDHWLILLRKMSWTRDAGANSGCTPAFSNRCRTARMRNASSEALASLAMTSGGALAEGKYCVHGGEIKVLEATLLDGWDIREFGQPLGTSDRERADAALSDVRQH
jgi:hypothetical protein